MSDFDHWDSDGATDKEIALLEASRSEGPSAAARARMAGALGMGASVVGTSSAAAKTSTAIGKWLLANAGKCVIVTAIGTTSVVAIRQAQRASTPIVTPPVRMPTSTQLHEISQGANALIKEAVSAPIPPVSTEIPARVAPSIVRATRPRAAPFAATSVNDELALLERAMRSMEQGDADAALARIDDYDRQRPSGELRIEACVLRIEALVALGRSSDAKRVASAFFAEFPDAPQAPRVRRLIRKVDAAP